jgi:hypothetical protein
VPSMPAESVRADTHTERLVDGSDDRCVIDCLNRQVHVSDKPCSVLAGVKVEDYPTYSAATRIPLVSVPLYK